MSQCQLTTAKVFDEQEINEIELAQLRADALRYRFLRTGAPYTIKYRIKGKDTTFHCGGHRVLAPSDSYMDAFDAAVDEAMNNATIMKE